MDSKKAKAKRLKLVDEKARRQARESYLKFVQYVFAEVTHARADEYKVNFHHRKMAKVIEEWVTGDIDRLIVSTPPRAGKTELCSRLLPGWILGRDPDSKIIGTAHSGPRAKKVSKAAKNVIKTDRYQRTFPEVEIPARNVRSDDRFSYTNTVSEWDLKDHAGGYLAKGTGQRLSGSGADYLLIDDPIAEQDAFSAKERENVYRWWQTEASTRLEEDGKVLLVMTRWHLDDLAGKLLSQESEHAKEWKEVRFPALSTQESVESEFDERDETDVPLWPFKTSKEDLLARRENDPHFSALYQQNPVPEGGAIIQEEWIEEWEEIPDPDGCRVVQSWDLRHGGQSSNSSYAVGLLFYQDRNNPSDVYLVDRVRGRWDTGETLGKIRDLQTEPMWKHTGPVLVENKADGKAAVSLLEGEVPGIVPVTPTASKEARIESCTPYFRAGNIHLPPEEEWTDSWTHELTSFPASTHDDQVDATSQAIRWMLIDNPIRSSDDIIMGTGSVTTDLF